MLTFKCLKCGYEAREFMKWQHHLFNSQHQNVVRNTFKNWEEEDNRKSLVLYAKKEAPPPLPSEIITLFHRQKIEVEDFVCWTSIPRMFIIQFQTSEEVDRVIQLSRQEPETFTINGKSVDFRRKSDVLEGEWGVYDSFVGEEFEIDAVEGSSKQVEIIEIPDDDDDDDISDVTAQIPETDNRKSTRDEEYCVEIDTVEFSDEEQEPEQSQDDEEQVVEIKSTMQAAFVKTFNSKVKLEKDDDDGEREDDKRKVKAQLKAMQKKWTEIYLGFHDRIWPICFGMANSYSVNNRKDTKYGCDIVFQSGCNPSKGNGWLSQSAGDENARKKADEFYDLLKNATKCNRKLKQLPTFNSSDTLLLSFKCRILILYNKSGAVAELTFSDLKGENVKGKMELVQLIFRKIWKKYELMKIEKFSSNKVEKPLCSSTEWNQIGNVDEDE